MAPPPPAPQRPGPLSVGATARQVVATLRGLLAYLPRVALAPFTLAFLAEGATLYLGGTGALGGAKGAVNPLIVLVMPLFVVAYVVFLVDWHRLTLLGPRPETTGTRLRVTRRDLRFFGKTLIVGILSSLIAAVPTAVFMPGLLAMAGGMLLVMLFATLVAVTAMLALGLVLPATAVDREYGIGDSWRATRTVLPQLLGLVAVLVLPAHLVVSVIGGLYGLAVGMGGLVVPLILLSQMAQFAELTLIATLLSVVFRRRSGVDLSV